MPEKLAALITCLREDGSDSSTVCLQPPYGTLVQLRVTKRGGLAVTLQDDDTIDLDYTTRKNLVFLGQRHDSMKASLKRVAGRAALESLLSNGIGFRTRTDDFVAPRTPAEFYAVTAFRHFNAILLKEHVRKSGKGKLTSLAYTLQRGGADFASNIGWEVLLACRHFEAHIDKGLMELELSGGTAAIVAEAVEAAAAALAPLSDGCFRLRCNGRMVAW